MLDSMVVNIVEDDQVVLSIYNMYHTAPAWGHGLCNLPRHNLDDLTPTIVMGDFNTHSRRWSFADQPASSWSQHLTDWFNH